MLQISDIVGLPGVPSTNRGVRDWIVNPARQWHTLGDGIVDSEGPAPEIIVYGRQLISVGALVGFKCWADPDLNTPESLEGGQVWINYDWVETPTAEHITFRSMINNGYLSEVLPVAA